MCRYVNILQIQSRNEEKETQLLKIVHGSCFWEEEIVVVHDDTGQLESVRLHTPLFFEFTEFL